MSILRLGAIDRPLTDLIAVPVGDPTIILPSAGLFQPIGHTTQSIGNVPAIEHRRIA